MTDVFSDRPLAKTNFSLTQQSSIEKSFLVRGGTLCVDFPLLSAGIVSGLFLCRFRLGLTVSVPSYVHMSYCAWKMQFLEPWNSGCDKPTTGYCSSVKSTYEANHPGKVPGKHLASLFSQLSSECVLPSDRSQPSTLQDCALLLRPGKCKDPWFPSPHLWLIITTCKLFSIRSCLAMRHIHAFLQIWTRSKRNKLVL